MGLDMGYEVRMHIHAENGYVIEEEGATHGWEIARLDLCKIGYEGPLFQLIRAAQADPNRVCGQFWADDGNTLISVDRYDDKLVRISGKEVLETIRKELKEDPYRRLKIALGLLETILESFKEDQIYCYFYGH